VAPEMFTQSYMTLFRRNILCITCRGNSSKIVNTHAYHAYQSKDASSKADKHELKVWKCFAQVKQKTIIT